MLKGLLEFFREKKPEIVRTEVLKTDYREGWLNSNSGTYWPSTWEEQEVQIVDWEKFEEALEEFSRTFEEGGENAHRNPLNKEKV